MRCFYLDAASESVNVCTRFVEETRDEATRWHGLEKDLKEPTRDAEALSGPDRYWYPRPFGRNGK